jgi:hypothetical protein
MMDRLFDVTLEVSGNPDTGECFYNVVILDRYNQDGPFPRVIGTSQAESLDAAMEFARGAVTAFLQGTAAH